MESFIACHGACFVIAARVPLVRRRRNSQVWEAEEHCFPCSHSKKHSPCVGWECGPWGITHMPSSSVMAITPGSIRWSFYGRWDSSRQQGRLRRHESIRGSKCESVRRGVLDRNRVWSSPRVVCIGVPCRVVDVVARIRRCVEAEESGLRLWVAFVDSCSGQGDQHRKPDRRGNRKDTDGRLGRAEAAIPGSPSCHHQSGIRRTRRSER